MRSKSAFTLTELLIVLLLLGVGIAILLPMFARSHRHPSMMKNNMQLRQISQGLLNYAAANNGYYAGLDSAGNIVTGVNAEGTGRGDTVTGRFIILLEGNYFNGEICLSPAETNAVTAWTTGRLYRSQVSYAMLNIATGANRLAEWRDRSTVNDKAILVSDRGIDNGPGRYKSLWTNPRTGRTDWKGGVVWSDGQVSTEVTLLMTDTKFDQKAYRNDDLFADGDPTGGGDAMMVYTDATTP